MESMTTVLSYGRLTRSDLLTSLLLLDFASWDLLEARSEIFLAQR